MSIVKKMITGLIALGVIACAANPISNAGAVAEYLSCASVITREVI